MERRALRARRRTKFLAGILVLTPVAITIFFLTTVFRFLDNALGPLLHKLLGVKIPGLGILVLLLLIYLSGVVATNVMGRRLVAWGEQLLIRLPLIKGIYLASKQLVEAVTLVDKRSFQRVVVVEYPRPGLFAYGFVTSSTAAEIKDGKSRKLYSVFVPTSPNPTSGILILVPEEELYESNLTIEEGIKLIVSGGIVIPHRVEVKPAAERFSESGEDG